MTLHEEVSALREQVAEASHQAQTDRDALASLLQQVVTIETRVTSMGAELSRQLHELGTDIEQLQQHVGDDSVMESVQSLKSAQIRLATEQARYEITFRHDLAALADLLRQRTR